MATKCYKAISRPSINFVKSTFTKPSLKPSITTPLSSPPLSRPFSQLGCLQSLLPLHSAVSSALLTSRLAVDSMGSRSLSLGMISGANPGV